MKRTPLIVAATASLLIGSIPASSMADDASDCQKLLGKRQLEACARIIDSANPDKSVLAYAYTVRGNSKRKDQEGAVADYDRTIALVPTYAYAYMARGNAKEELDDLNGALADLNRSIELDPGSAYAFDGRGVARERLGDLDGAIADFSHAIELDPQTPLAYLHRAGAREEKGDKSGADSDYDLVLARFTRAIEHAPEQGMLYYHRGVVRYSREGVAAAIADLNQAIQLDPRNSYALQTRGKIRLINGEYTLAVDDLLRSFELDPDAEGALLLYLARAHSGKNGLDELAANRNKIEQTKWPIPVVAFYLGRYPAQALYGVANDARPGKRSKTCEANFYLGEWNLVNNDTTRAVPLLRAALTKCSLHGFARDEAAAELNRLGSMNEVRKN